jgi:hypothetical protein
MPLNFDQIEALPSGAYFVLADLHVHTTASYDVKDASMTPEGVVDAALLAKIAIVAVTDHNEIKGAVAAHSYAAKFNSDILVIPGIEVTTPNGHLLVYFERLAELEKFFHSLKLVDDQQHSRTTQSMFEVIDAADKMDGVCIAAHIEANKGFEGGSVGYDPWKKDVVTHRGLVGLEFRDPANRLWYSASEPGASPEAQNRRRIFGERIKNPDARGGGALARVCNSDAHTLVDFTAGKSLTRIKISELSYGSFQNALADPEARIKIDAILPKTVPRIVGLETSGGFLDGLQVHFSRNLNVFFGGRGTGKTSAIRAIAFALGRINLDTAPFDSARIFCEDSDGTRYRFDRSFGGSVVGTLQTADGTGVTSVFGDAFSVEYIGQGELSDVAKECLSDSRRLQAFLDTHLQIAELVAREKTLATETRQIAQQLAPLMASVEARKQLEKSLEQVQAQLKASEDGKLHVMAAWQNMMNAERSYRAALIEVAGDYRRGVSFRNNVRETREMRQAARIEKFSLTAAEAAFLAAEAVVDETNDFLVKTARDINKYMLGQAERLSEAVVPIAAAHNEIQARVDAQLEKLREQNLASTIKDFNLMSARKNELVGNIARLDAQTALRDELTERFEASLAALAVVRAQIIAERKGQLDRINIAFKSTFKQYLVRIIPDDAGITAEFESFIDEKMHGTRYPREAAAKFARAIAPAALADILQAGQGVELAKVDGVGDWAETVLVRLGVPEIVLQLRAMWKPYVPVFKVQSPGEDPKELNFKILSDGQKHTILLTVALLSESRSPLVMDQPEDDLDNQFIFETVVSTLREVKESRQVILVTHNANIAVLADSEQLLAMQQTEGMGSVASRGSIDDSKTKAAVQDCLEGGDKALRRRAEVYGWRTSRIAR